MNDFQIQKYFYHLEKPVLRNSLYIHMDILGFKEAIERDDFFQNVYDVLHENYSEGHQTSPIFAKTFSDNVAWILPYFSDKPSVEAINLVISTIQSYQFRFIKKGIFLRGATTIGKIFHDDLILYGKSLIEAYELESKIAIYPRIILSADFFSCVKKNHFYPDGDYCNHPLCKRKDILVGSDGQPFINYLNKCKNFDKNEVYWDDMRILEQTDH